MTKKNLSARGWFYFRMGWSTYFAFILAAVNTAVITYYLALERISFVKEIFPTFANYFLTFTIVGIPLLIFIGYIHYKRSPIYKAEADIGAEANPYNFKLPPGYNPEAVFPLYLLLTQVLLRLVNGEKLSEDEQRNLEELQKKLTILINGGYIGNPQRKDM